MSDRRIDTLCRLLTENPSALSSYAIRWTPDGIVKINIEVMALQTVYRQCQRPPSALEGQPMLPEAPDVIDAEFV